MQHFIARLAIIIFPLFQQYFGIWTSENEQIDKLIQYTQLNSRYRGELFEWIPYDRLRNIKYLAQGGFGIVHKVICLDGWLSMYNFEEKIWLRTVYNLDEQNYKDASNSQIKNPLKNGKEFGMPVVLKSLNNSSNINENFLNEWKRHLQCHYKAYSHGAPLIPILGMTQVPDTLNYIVV
ncbi:kinase-like domain-containing protein [Rhizophagus clarus]|uniref:Kinase-like domain-containing protein n=1 Tax=Rhizophagus clarus TaxID=94130 RepID=A0A8H3QYL0_9GLOM|nr:kinase-like domain-containing protein [Rhizophagus clarus]